MCCMHKKRESFWGVGTAYECLTKLLGDAPTHLPKGSVVETMAGIPVWAGRKVGAGGGKAMCAPDSMACALPYTFMVAPPPDE